MLVMLYLLMKCDVCRGSEDDPAYKAHSGNEEPKGYGMSALWLCTVTSLCLGLSNRALTTVVPGML